MMWWDGGWSSSAAWVWMSVMMLVVAAFVVWAVLDLDRRAKGRPSAGEAILAERLARKEIDEAEYGRRVEALHAGGHSARGSGSVRR